MPGRHGVPRADIIALLHKGYSNREIGRLLRTNPLRVGQIRKELDLPPYERPPAPTLHEKWAARTKPVTFGHMRWTGGLRSGMPNLMYQQRNYSARRVAFEIGHGRQPLGRVLPNCGQPWCIAPEHATDEPMRRADLLYGRIFGASA